MRSLYTTWLMMMTLLLTLNCGFIAVPTAPQSAANAAAKASLATSPASTVQSPIPASATVQSPIGPEAPDKGAFCIMCERSHPQAATLVQLYAAPMGLAIAHHIPFIASAALPQLATIAQHAPNPLEHPPTALLYL